LAKAASDFWTVCIIVDLFKERGCELRVAEPTVHLDDGDCFNARYLLNPETGAFVPLIDLDDYDKVSETELAFWERRLGITIPRPKLH
jgi:hypothetical protein